MNNKGLKRLTVTGIQSIAKEQNLATLSQRLFKRYSNISPWGVNRVFKSWNETVAEAGLQPDTSVKKKFDD
jgi:hypothetical protein